MMTFDRQDQLKYTNAVKRVSFSLNFLSLYFNPLCVMKCLYFRPLFKYFEVLRVHSDMILFLMNEKKLDVLSDVMCYLCHAGHGELTSLWIILTGTNTTII